MAPTKTRATGLPTATTTSQVKSGRAADLHGRALLAVEPAEAEDVDHVGQDSRGGRGPDEEGREEHGHRAEGVDPEPELFTESDRVDLREGAMEIRVVDREPATVQDSGAEQVEGDRAHGADGAGDPCVELHDANPAARTTSHSADPSAGPACQA